MKLDNLTQEELKVYLNYDKETGVFTWKKNVANNVKSGSVAGCIGSRGYIEIGFRKKQHKAHRLAWLYVYGFYPKDKIDHINGNRSDNRVCNLREANHMQNMQNQKRPQSKNKTGYLGVSTHGINQRYKKIYRSSIMVNGYRKFLGSYETAELAHEAYLKAKREMHEFCTI